jgi:Integrase
MKLTNSFIKTIEPSDKIVKHSDGASLFLVVHPTGKKTWIYAYRFEGKQKKLVIGPYPQMSLKDARKARQDARELLEQDIDPGAKKQNDKQNHQRDLFGNIAEKWFTLYKEDHADKSISLYKNILDTHLLPKIGNASITDIKRIQLVDLVTNNTIFKATKDRMQYKNKIAASTALKMCHCLSMIFKYAINIGILEYSVATQLSTILPDPEFSNYRTMIKKEDVKLLLQTLRTPSYASKSVWYFLNILPYVFVRNTELRCAKWDEFNFETKEWHVPAQRMKGKKIEKQHRMPHFVPLANQVIDLLRELKNNSNSEYLFPAQYNKNKCITDVAPLIALKRFDFCQTVHGFRTIASTYLHELNYPTHVIEAQMAHKDENKVRATYNKAEYKDERIKMMQEWADYIDALVDST